MSTRPGAVAVPILLIALLGSCRGPAPPPHVVLVTADTLRADHLSVHGYPRETSPAIDAFARGAWRFEDAVTVIPKTGPSFSTLFTGMHPTQHGVRSNFEAVPPGILSLAEAFRRLGYRTAAFVGNPVLRDTKGYGRGFDVYEHFNDLNADAVRQVNDAFSDWAAAAWDRPTFVWIHYMDPHGPYTPPAEFESLFLEDAWSGSDERVPLEPDPRRTVDPNTLLGALPAYHRRGTEDRVAGFVARYDAEIRYVDAAFAEVVALLQARGLYDPSAIVFTSDHGESLGEHDLYFEHGWFAYEATLHVPLMIKLPGQTEGRVATRPVSNLDLLPTLLALADVEPDPTALGADLFATDGPRPPVLVESADRYPVKYVGVRTSGWKYLRNRTDGMEELYDLRHDPAETVNLVRVEPDRLAELRDALEQALRAVERAGTVAPFAGPPDDPETLERLRALGYTQ